jgi:hypothetical protein
MKYAAHDDWSLQGSLNPIKKLVTFNLFYLKEQSELAANG